MLKPLSSEFDGDAADFLDRPADQGWGGCALAAAEARALRFSGDGGLARRRIAAIMAVFRFRTSTPFRRPTLTPVLPHLRMLLSLDGFSSDCRPVRGCVIARRSGGTGGGAECPSHASAAP